MDFTLTEEQSLLRDAARAYFARKAGSATRAGMINKVWTDISDMGWLAVLIPSELGGIGGSIVDGCLLAQELGRSHTAVPFAGTAILGPSAFANRPEMLEKIAAGSARLAFSLQDGEADRLIFEKKDGGYVLRGSRRFVRCDVGTTMYILNAFDEERGLPALFAVPSDMPSISANRYPTLDGIGAIGLSFEPELLDSDLCIAIGEDAREILSTLHLAECLAYSAEAVGLMEYLLNTTREYAVTREQFGQPISGFQVVRHKLVEMYEFWQLAESLVFQAADTFVRLGLTTETSQSVRAAFSYVGRQGRRVGKEAIQLHGAVGTMDELPVGHAFARLVAISQSCGGAAFHERSYAKEVISAGDSSRLWAL